MSTILRWITLLQNWSVTGKGLGDKVDKLDRRRIVKGIKEVLRFDVPMKDVYRMTSGNSLAHLSEHGGDQT